MACMGSDRMGALQMYLRTFAIACAVALAPVAITADVTSIPTQDHLRGHWHGSGSMSVGTTVPSFLSELSRPTSMKQEAAPGPTRSGGTGVVFRPSGKRVATTRLPETRAFHTGENAFA